MQIPMSMPLWRWPMLLTVTETLEPALLITCGRGQCREAILDLSAAQARGYPIELGQINALVLDHVNGKCRSGTIRAVTEG
ncbi:hypothetical protein [Rugosimonospora africana]|nr:hypothetical protein [Rugosimonospora africana]